MSILKLLLFLFALSIVSCSNETYEEEDMDVTDPDTSLQPMFQIHWETIGSMTWSVQVLIFLK